MHASIWKFAGDPEELLRCYDAMVSDIPAENMRMHLCLRLPDGLLLLDTCPSKQVFDAFASSEEFRALRAAHALPDPESVEDYPVHAAFFAGKRVP